MFMANSDLHSTGVCNSAPVTLQTPSQLEALGTAQVFFRLGRPSFAAPRLLASPPGGRQAGVCLGCWEGPASVCEQRLHLPSCVLQGPALTRL